MGAYLPAVVLVWVAGSVMVTMVAREKGRTPVWALVCSLVFSPILAYGYYLAVPAQSRVDQNARQVYPTRPGTWVCSRCQGSNQKEATSCASCGTPNRSAPHA
jgi:hypothetical protein